MKKIFRIPALFAFVSLLLMAACHCPVKTTSSDSFQIPGPKVIIYQTKADYSQNVPVLLSDDKKSIASYPHPHDLIVDGKLVTPTLLHNNFQLDNRGINKNVAFLKYTYEDYSKLQNPPSPEELYGMILDKKPLKKMYICKKCIKSQTDIQWLNNLIDSGNFSEFNKIK